jgi:uncharacterized protein YndB with AHSA1/START domain
MSRVTVRFVRTTTAVPETVWSLLADGRGWPRWTLMHTARLDREGYPQPDGVGAVRRFRSGLAVVREEVTAFEPPHRFRYRLLSGFPADDYVGEAVLTPTDEGTSITWTVTFRARYRGTRALCRLAVWLILGDFSRRLARVSAVEDASAAP